MESTAGSSTWQIVFISFALMLVLFQVVHGWRAGLMRQLARLGALIAAYFVAYFGGAFFVSMLRPWLRLPDFLLSVVAGAVLALIVYTVVNTLGTILFKRTGQQRSGTVRLLYGFSGAVLGFLFGAFFLWLIVVGIRSLGTVADAQIEAQKHARPADPGAAPLDSLDESESPTRETAADSELITTLARLKNSVEMGAIGQMVKSSDVTPNAVYQTLGRVGEVAATPEAAQRFLSYPGAKELTTHPKIVALREDQEIIDMIQQGRLLDLLQDQRLIDAANDPTLSDRIKKFDLNGALNHARRSRE